MPPFFAEIEPDPAVARGYRFLLEAIADYTTKGRLGDAARVRAVLAQMFERYEKLAVDGAIHADKVIKRRIHSTAVRPPTSGRLEGAIHSRPTPVAQTSLPAGAVDIADIAVLDKAAVNPRGGGIYWRAQEYGLPVFPDQRPAPGYFMPGTSAPDINEFRNHPYFEQMAYSRGMPALVRTRPLNARRFLRDGVDEIVVWHNARAQSIQQTAITELLTLLRR
jgi:hypothetical protein